MAKLLKSNYVFITLFLILFLSLISVAADDKNEDGGSGIFGEDGAKELGSWSIGFMIVGSTYIILRRSYIYSKRYLTKEEYLPLKENISKFYKKTKGPLLNIHNLTMILASILALIHGIYLGDDFEAIGLSGWIAAILMIILSTSGVVIWLKFRPIWNYRTSRTQIRFIHRQWLFSGIMVIALIFHLIIFED